MATINPHIHFNGNAEEADALFNKLSVGGTIEMPIGDSPWGTYFAMFRDQFGIEWMIELNL